VVGLLATAVHRLPGTHSHAAAALVFALAAVWALLPIRRRALVACHRVDPLAASGWRADRDCLRYGASIGAACVTTCWLLMLGCALTGHALPAMLAGAAIAAKERRSFRSPVKSVALATAALAMGYAALAVLG
jgi:predicted metal-binding membrane protein